MSFRLNSNSVPFLTRRFLTALAGMVGVALASHCCAAVQAQIPTGQQLEHFEKHVRPLLAEHCYECHSIRAKKIEAELLLDSRQRILTGGESGPSIIPGNPDESLLIQAVRYESFEMPPSGRLKESEVKVLADWIAAGAPWPDEPEPTADVTRPQFDLRQRKAEHWAWQPMQSTTPPTVNDAAWAQSELDLYIQKDLEAAGLHPAAAADRGTVARRLYFDLIGLPPTPQQMDAFLSDSSPQAVAKLVDQLLASPHFGERWARHWLDLTRYAESRGHEFDDDAADAYQYRDYVIRALNADIPYDQFVREQIAGDLLPEPRLNPETGANESIVGTGFWFLGEWVHSPVDIRKDETDRFDNMIDVMSKTFLGTTVSCTRCHDHKFDPISSRDYYALSGFLQSSDYREARFESMEHNRKVAEQLHSLDTLMAGRLAVLMQSVFPEATIPALQVPALEIPANAIVFDYGQPDRTEFRQDGFIWGKMLREAGTPLPGPGREQAFQMASITTAASDSFWDGLKSQHGGQSNSRGRLSSIPRSGRTLRAPTFELTNAIVECRVRGAGSIVACVDSHRLVAGPLHGETVRDFSAADGWQWVRMDLGRYVGHRLHLEFTPAENQTLEVQVALQGATPEQRQLVEQRELQLAEQTRNVLETISHAFTETPETLQAVKQIQDDWKQQRDELRKQVKLDSYVAMAMMDGTGEDDHVLIRGSSANPGEVVPRRFLEMIDGPDDMPIASGSGRLQLAERINDPANPLTSRVIVNRLWHHLVGRGIVPTTDDFGVLGQRPTHPQLLDHLALRFLADGRSLKKAIRYIVLSSTYQMSSHVDPTALEKDPGNLLWHHIPPRRLEGEVIRDALLAVSGRLDEQVGGEPIPIHLTAFMDGRGRPGKSGPLNGDNRRSIYVAVRRNFLSPFMLAFDTPVPFSTMGRRNVSNVPAQALILLNDPLVVELTKAWGERARNLVPLGEGESPDERIRWMYQAGLGRLPSEAELEVSRQFLQATSKQNNVPMDHPELWSDLAHALVNTKEFVFLR
ncbi:MAG: PSD1 domain-containing protein [Planctomycetaceae bacterium]|nr:PSD1 domain-containing protein [Planctomycetaceae bacterium]